MVGTQFGLWTVLEIGIFHIDKKRRWKREYFLCRCTCGVEREIKKGELINGESGGCTKCRHAAPERNPRYVHIPIGASFGGWTVIGERQKFGTQIKYLCRCTCGTEKHVNKQLLVNGSSLGCLVCTGRTTGDNNQARVVLFTKHRYDAKPRQIAFSLNRKEWLHLTSSDCYYYGAAPANVFRFHEHSYTYNGIDRMDGTKGYENKNCVSCCARCNYAKGTQTHDEFIAMCHAIAERH